MEFSKPAVLLWFSICVTSVCNAINRPSHYSPKIGVLDLLRNSAYDRHKAYESAIALESEYEWSISVQNLPECYRESGSSKCGTMCITYIRSKTSDDDWVEYHRTDLVLKKKPATNAEFVKLISIPRSLRGYYSIKFELRSVSTNDEGKIKFGPILGYVEQDLRGLRHAIKTILVLEGENREDRKEGYLTIHSEKLVNNFDLVYFELSGKKLDYARRRKKLNPFIKIYKRTAENDYVLVGKTEVINDSSNPMWSQIGIPIKHFCNGNYERILKFVCMDFDEDGNDYVIGEFETTMNYLVRHTNRKFDFINSNKEKIGPGEINFRKFYVIHLPSFSDHIADGLRLQYTIAIDFTEANNGNGQTPTSDTSSDPEAHGARRGTASYKDNDISIYEKALVSISTLIEDFDRDRKVFLLGYGLRSGSNGSLDDELKDDHLINSSECVDSQGILEAYHNLLSTAQLSSGSSFLSPIIRKFAYTAKLADADGEYSILIILTGGSISDLDKTKQALLEVSKFSATIFIVGIGDSTFENIKKLVNDNTFSADGDGEGNVYFTDFKRFRAFDADDVRWYMGRELFFTQRDQLKFS